MKIVNIEDISALDSSSIVTVGMFDGVHQGHRHLIAKLLSLAAERTLRPVVVTFDRHPRLVMDAQAPLSLLSTYEERMSLLEGCGVDTVALVRFTRETAALSACSFARQYLCHHLRMRTLLLGYDNMFGSRQHDDFEQLPQLAEACGFDICRDDAVLMDGVEVSSTKVRRALQQGDLRRANAMLGTPYSLSGRVVHGRHVGTGLGFPTANIQPEDSHKMLPGAGVYAMRASVGGRDYVAMANLGDQPTFHSEHPVLEVHLLDFDGDLYGCEVRVTFLEKLRDIRQFESPEALRQQLERDRADVARMATGG